MGQGLIYRDTRMVNWSTKLQTAVSDIEVVSQHVTKPVKIDGYVLPAPAVETNADAQA